MSELAPLYVYATRDHYVRHLRPIGKALAERGVKVNSQRPPAGALVLVASGTDATEMNGRKVIYVEHGAGQSYDGDPNGARNGTRGYPGGSGVSNAVLFICPNQSVADRWNETYPDTPTAVVGCPALDAWHAAPPTPTQPRVALTFHWPSPFSPEAGTAWPEYSRYIQQFLIPKALYEGWSLVGHSHPRWGDNVTSTLQSYGIPTVSYERVMDTATLLIADNTSMLPEFASTGRPVLFLNSEGWRRDIHHGGRFWEWPEGQVSCDDPARLMDAVRLAMADGPAIAAARQRMVDSVYAYTDGKASDRAADAIIEVLASA